MRISQADLVATALLPYSSGGALPLLSRRQRGGLHQAGASSSEAAWWTGRWHGSDGGGPGWARRACGLARRAI